MRGVEAWHEALHVIGKVDEVLAHQVPRLHSKEHMTLCKLQHFYSIGSEVLEGRIKDVCFCLALDVLAFHIPSFKMPQQSRRVAWGLLNQHLRNLVSYSPASPITNSSGQIWKPLDVSRREIRLFSIEAVASTTPSRSSDTSIPPWQRVHDRNDPLFSAPLTLALHTFSLFDLEEQEHLLIDLELQKPLQRGEDEHLNHQGLLRRYHAISYVCGDVQDTVPVTIDGHAYPLLRSLATALRYFRYEDDQEAAAARESLQRSGSTFGRLLKYVLYLFSLHALLMILESNS